VSPALSSLQAALAAGSRALDIPVDDAPFSPHVTLARRVQQRVNEPLRPSICWSANEFALIVSDNVSGGVRYRVVQRWPLSAPTAEKAAASDSA